MIKHKVYTLHHPITHEIRYVGYTYTSLKERLRLHVRDVKKESVKSHKKKWIKSLLNQNLYPVINLVQEFDLIEDALEKEKELIALYKSNGIRLVNHTPGGEFGMGYKFSPESISIMVKKRTGKKIGTKEERLLAQKEIEIQKELKRKELARIRDKKYKDKKKEERRLYRINNPKVKLVGELNPFFGKKHSAESLEKMRKAKLGKKHGEEFSKKMSKILKGRKCKDETKKKISDKNKEWYKNNQRIVSDETRKKLAAVWTGRRHSLETIEKMKLSWIKRKEELK